MAKNPFATPLLQPSKTTPRVSATAALATTPKDPDALYHRLIQQAATSRDRAGFLRAHQHELAQLNPAARQVVVRSAGLGIPPETVAKALSPGSYANTQLRKAAHDVQGIPGGLYHAAGAVVSDVKDTAYGHPTLKRTFKVAKQTGQGVVQTVKHPGRDLFQTGSLAVAAVSGGAGTAGRFGAIADVVKATPAADLATAVGRLTKADSRAYATLVDPKKHLASIDEHTARRITTPSPELGRVLDLDPHLSAVRSEVVKTLGDGKLVPRKAGAAATVREAGASKPAQVAKAAVKTPLPKQRTLVVRGEGGKPAITVHPVASKNLAANLVERRVIDPLRQRALDKAGPAREFSRPTVQKAAEAVQRLGSAQTKVGRELRAERAVTDALELAPVSRLARFHPSAPARGVTRLTGGRVNVPTLLPRKLGGERLSAAEQKAVDIMAADSNPGKMVDYHENLIARGVGDERAHRVQIALSKAAGPHFNRLMTGDHPKLAQAVEETRAVIGKGEQLKGLSPEEIAHRVGARKADIEAIAVGKLSPLEEIQQIQDTLGPRAAAPGRVEAQIQKLEGLLAAKNVASRQPHVAKYATAAVQKKLDRLRTLSQGKTGVEADIAYHEGLLKENLAQQARYKVPPAQRVAGQTAAGLKPDATLAKLRRQESTLRTRLEDLGQHKKLRGIHQSLVDEGFKAIENGAFYLPSRDRALARTRVPATRQPGEYGLGPTGNPPWLAHAFTGALQRTGRARSDATRLASESYKQAQRYATIERGYRQLLAAARDTREAAGGSFAIPIRATTAIPDALKRVLQKSDVGELTRQDIKYLRQEDLDAFVRELFPEDPNVPGVKWIDSRYLGGLRAQGSSFAGGAGSVLDLFNNPFRAALLYTKPSYALNLLQALGTNAIQQGVFTPVNLRAALRLGKTLGAEDQHAIFSLVGAGLSRTYEASGGLGASAINTIGEAWNKVVDRYPRAASWLHEARREGFNTPEKIHALINHPQMQDKLVEITRRANKEAIEFGQLSPFEANVLRRFFFFYGWLRGATLYSLRFPKEHPVQAAVAAQLGGQGHELSVRAFGPFVDFAAGTPGLVPIGKNRGSNLSNLNTFSTPVEAAEALADPSKIPAQLGPGAGALYTLLAGKTPTGFEVPATKNRYGAAGQQLLNLVPFVQALNRAKQPPPTDKVVKQPIYPKGTRAAIERYVGGSAFPQPVNKPALAAKGEKNYREKLGAEAKVRYDAAKTLRQAEQDAVVLHRAGVLRAPGLPASVRQALDLDRRRKLAYAQAAKQLGVPVTNLSAADKAGVTARVVGQAKTASEQVIANYQRLVAAAADATEAKNITAAFWRTYGRGEALSSWRHYVTTNKRQR